MLIQIGSLQVGTDSCVIAEARILTDRAAAKVRVSDAKSPCVGDFGQGDINGR
jgi:hypothetical protein